MTHFVLRGFDKIVKNSCAWFFSLEIFLTRFYTCPKSFQYPRKNFVEAVFNCAALSFFCRLSSFYLLILASNFEYCIKKRRTSYLIQSQPTLISENSFPFSLHTSRFFFFFFVVEWSFHLTKVMCSFSMIPALFWSPQPSINDVQLPDDPF